MMLEIIGYVIISLALAMTVFSVSIYTSIYRCLDMNESMVMSLMFSFFQSFLLILGFYTGRAIEGSLGSLTYPLAIMILGFIAIRMILGARRVNTTSRTYAAKNLAVLAALSLMIAINAFLAGIGLGLISIDVMVLAGILFFTNYILTLVGVRIGKTGKHQLGRQSELFGGSLLFLIALVMFFQYVNIL